MRGKKYLVIMSFLLSLFMCPLDVNAASSFTVSASCQRGQKVKISITVSNYDDVTDGYDIFRFNTVTGTYDLVATMDIYENGFDYYMDSDAWNDYYQTGKLRFCYDVIDVHTVGETYYYQVKSFEYSDDYKKYDDDFYYDDEISEEESEDAEVTEEENAANTESTKIYQETVDTTVTILADGPKITYGKRKGTLNAQLKWTKDENADGYLIYYVKNYTNKSKPQMVNIYQDSSYTLAKEIKMNTTTSVGFKKLMNGVTYTYRICSYKIIDGQKVVSMMSEPKSILMNYYSYNGETYNQKIKRAFGSEKKMNKNFKTSSKAAKQMKLIKIKVWDFKNGKNGKKVTKTKYLTVNKRMAPSIKAMFDEIYKAKEKQVIKDIGCYSYRTGEHMYGLAIDINPNENYMIDGDTILAGSFWKPKKSKYSIPLNCETVRIMERYGFYRGFWGDRKDYMHFSYFGT